MATIISGKELSASMKAEMAAAVKEFPAKYGRAPHLVVVLVGDDPASVSYVTGKATTAWTGFWCSCPCRNISTRIG